MVACSNSGNVNDIITIVVIKLIILKQLLQVNSVISHRFCINEVGSKVLHKADLNIDQYQTDNNEV